MSASSKTAAGTMEPQPQRKRKRAAVACTVCHDRKVRCNIALVGKPCGNCAQDGTHCKVYGQQTPVQPGQPLRPRETPRETQLIYPSPSDSANNHSEDAHSANIGPRDSAVILASPTSVESSDHHHHVVSPSQIQQLPHHGQPKRCPEPEPTVSLVPYYAGEAEGLEFLFDLASPTRPIKGGPYIVAKSLHKRDFLLKQATVDDLRPLFDVRICDQLIRCFFYYAYPFLPVVNAGEFLQKYATEPSKLSPLLLWSVLFAAGNYLDDESVKAAGFKNRKSLKEYCYQNAKTIYDAQLEPEKSNIIASALMLAFWFVDLEDIDGTWHWIGVAINLAQSIGLHREPNYERLARCPFPPSQQALWRRLWWSCYQRDVWIAMGLGRPVRIHLDDCDVRLPSVNDILGDFKDMDQQLLDLYVPRDVTMLAQFWIKHLQLSAKVEDVLLLHYRPRRPLLSLAQLEKDDSEIWQLLDAVPSPSDLAPPVVVLHHCLLKTYFNTVIIALHRSYMVSSQHHLLPDEQIHLKSVSISRCKNAANSTTSILNRLISLDMIELSPSTMTITLMGPMQIHFYEYVTSEGLAKQHAYHNINLHQMVLSHLKKTYWAADMQHKLFLECLKAADPKAAGFDTSAELTAQLTQHRGPHQADPTVAAGDVGPPAQGGSLDAVPPPVADPALDEFYWGVNPFWNLQSIFDPSVSAEYLSLDGIYR